MKLQRVFFFFFAVNALTFVALPRFAKADEVRQLQGCNEVNQPPLPASDAAYRDAMALAQTLIKRRFVVTCMSPSKMTGTFEGQDGAAVYRTNQGDFEALFLPHPKNLPRWSEIPLLVCRASRTLASQSDRQCFPFVFRQTWQRVDRRGGSASCGACSECNRPALRSPTVINVNRQSSCVQRPHP